MAEVKELFDALANSSELLKLKLDENIELQRRVKELEESLKQAIEELQASYGRSRLMPDNTCESINRWESLLSNSGAPKEKP